MKFAFATKLFFAAAVSGTGEARLRRLQAETTTGNTAGTASAAADPVTLSSLGTNPAPGTDPTSSSGADGFTLGGTATNTAANTATNTAQGQTRGRTNVRTIPRTHPMQELQGHIGGGVHADGIRVLNNIGYALVGYDLVKGNPLDTSGLVKIDLGFRNAIFAPEEYVLMVDQEYYAPANLNVLECQGCNMHATSRVLESMGDYVASLTSKVQARARHTGVTSGAFSASHDFQQTSHLMNQEHETSTESEISCCVYQAELQSYDLPPYSRNFEIAVQRLKDAADTETALRKLTEETATDDGEEAPVTLEEEAVFAEEAVTEDEATEEPPTLLVGTLLEEIERFVQEFGTHYVKKVTMGSLYGEQIFITQEQRREMNNQNIDIRAAAEVSVATSSGAGGFGLNSNVQEAQEFLGRTSRKSVYARGAKPVGGGDIDLWLAYSSDNPVPTYVEVEPIEELPIYEDPLVVNALTEYISTYCDRLTGADCTQYEAGSHMDRSSMRQGARFSADQRQPHLHDTETTNFPHNEDFVFDAEPTKFLTGFKGTWTDVDGNAIYFPPSLTAAGLALAGTAGRLTAAGLALADPLTDGVMTYSAKVSSLNSNNARVPGGSGMTAMSAWQNADLVCGPNEAVVGTTVDYATWNSDKRWGINCASIQGMEVLNTRMNGLSMISAEDVNDDEYANTLQEDWEDDCPENHVMIGLVNVHDYTLDDTHWKLRCALIRPSADTMDNNEVSVTPLWNELTESFVYRTPSRSVLKGLLGTFSPNGNDPQNSDSRYSFAEMYAGVATIGSTWKTESLLPDTPVDGEEHTLDCGSQALTGMRSEFVQNEGFGRNFQIECRAIQGHRLIQHDGSPATASGEIQEGDWTSTFVGSGSSFGIECEGTKVLAGVKVKFNAANNDLGWKGLCLGLVAN